MLYRIWNNMCSRIYLANGRLRFIGSKRTRFPSEMIVHGRMQELQCRNQVFGILHAGHITGNGEYVSCKHFHKVSPDELKHKLSQRQCEIHHSRRTFLSSACSIMFVKSSKRPPFFLQLSFTNISTHKADNLRSSKMQTRSIGPRASQRLTIFLR